MSDARETWKEFDNSGYQVSSLGRVRTPEMKILTPTIHNHNYLRVYFQGRAEYVHRMVLIAFCGICPHGWEADHLNKDRQDNRLDNLRWLPKLRNLQHRLFHIGENNKSAKLTEAQVRLIRNGPFYKRRDWDLAKLFGVSRETIRDARNGKCWAHIK